MPEMGLAGCGIWLIFVGIFGMGAENRSRKREFQLRAGAGFCVFKGSECENRKGNETRIYIPAQGDRNGSFVYEVCRLSSNECSLNVKLDSISPFVMFCIDFGHFHSRHFHHKNEISRMSCCISWPCLRP